MKRSIQENMNPTASLRSLVDEALQITRQLIAASGELTPELEALLSLHGNALTLKLDSYAHIDERLDAEAAFFRRKSADIAKIAKGLESARERLRNNIKFAMGELNTKELKGSEYRFVLSKSKAKLIIGETIDPAYTMTVSEVVPDKERIRVALEDGFKIEGCYLEEVSALRVYETGGDKS